MKLEDQVCTLEQAKRLKELGIEQESVWVWLPAHENFPDRIRLFMKADNWFYIDNQPGKERYSAFTVAELGVMLPNYLALDELYSFYQIKKISDSGKQWEIYFYGLTKELKKCRFRSYTEAEARAAMLIYLLENKLITAKEVNEKLNAEAIPYKEVN